LYGAACAAVLGEPMAKQWMSCSARLLRPFLAVLEKHVSADSRVDLVPDAPIGVRIAVASFHDLLTRWVDATHDPDLGLRAGRLTAIGTCGALDYALRSAPTMSESVELARRYAHLYSDALEFAIVKQDDRASIRITGLLCTVRASTDFMLATWYCNHLRPHLDAGARLECYFSYPKPASIDVHRSVFGDATLHFGAPFNGFAFDQGLLDCALETAELTVHPLHCEQLEREDSLAVHSETLANRVRWILAAELQQGRPTSSGLARQLRMSRRTLVRRLAREGTTFTSVLDGLRRQLGTSLVHEGTLPMCVIAELVGFAHAQAFHRSFKRWTGMTPTRYRETNEPGPAAA
jgi:AraC-like DNA-binding protein